MAVVLTCLLALNLYCIPAFAQETEILTVVPETHSIAVAFEKGGAVIDGDGAVHTEPFTAEVPHDGTLALTLRPDSGYALDTALLAGQVVDVSAGQVEIAHVRQGGTLAVAWKEAPAAPSEKTYTIVGTVTENGKPAAGVTLELRSRLKTFVTGADGKFRFDKAESGEHSLTALRDGKAVGYLQFKLDESGTDVSLARLPDGSFEVTMDKDVTTLELYVVTHEGGTMEIAEVKSITDKQAEEIYPPSTGDDTRFVWWLAALLAAGAVILLRMLRNRKRQKK